MLGKTFSNISWANMLSSSTFFLKDSKYFATITPTTTKPLRQKRKWSQCAVRRKSNKGKRPAEAPPWVTGNIEKTDILTLKCKLLDFNFSFPWPMTWELFPEQRRSTPVGRKGELLTRFSGLCSSCVVEAQRVMRDLNMALTIMPSTFWAVDLLSTVVKLFPKPALSGIQRHQLKAVSIKLHRVKKYLALGKEGRAMWNTETGLKMPLA